MFKQNKAIISPKHPVSYQERRNPEDTTLDGSLRYQREALVEAMIVQGFLESSHVKSKVACALDAQGPAYVLVIDKDRLKDRIAIGTHTTLSVGGPASPRQEAMVMAIRQSIRLNIGDTVVRSPGFSVSFAISPIVLSGHGWLLKRGLAADPHQLDAAQGLQNEAATLRTFDAVQLRECEVGVAAPQAKVEVNAAHAKLRCPSKVGSSRARTVERTCLSRRDDDGRCHVSWGPAPRVAASGRPGMLSDPFSRCGWPNHGQTLRPLGSEPSVAACITGRAGSTIGTMRSRELGCGTAVTTTTEPGCQPTG